MRRLYHGNAVYRCLQFPKVTDVQRKDSTMQRPVAQPGWLAGTEHTHTHTRERPLMYVTSSVIPGVSAEAAQLSSEIAEYISALLSC